MFSIVLSVLIRFTASDYLFWYLVSIVLSVLIRFTASHHPFGIFKLFFNLCGEHLIENCFWQC